MKTIRWKWVLLSAVVPPVVVVYVRALAWLVDLLHAPPHERLVDAIHYAGQVLRLLAQPSPAAAITVVVVVTLLREPISRMVKLKVEGLGATVSAELGPPPAEIGTKLKAPDAQPSASGQAVPVTPEASK